MVDFLNTLREQEFKNIFEQEPVTDLQQRNVMELGSGTGQQLQLLQSKFHSAMGIEIENSNYKNDRTDNIILYNGVDIPFQDETFDCIFSSNVMEHIPDLPHMNKELARVLKKDGVAIHVMPTHVWRIWTTISGYLSIPKRILKSFFKSDSPKIPSNSYKSEAPKSRLSAFVNMLVPARHGERGNVISEIFYFHPSWWIKQFSNSRDWEVHRVYGNQLFYTGHNLLGSLLSWNTRVLLAKILGSSCKVYILKKRK